MKIENVFIADIAFATSPRVRASLQADAIDDYAALYAKNIKILPPPDVFKMDGGKWLMIADGRHRICGAKQAGLKQIPCRVHEGTADECWEMALRANHKNTTARRTNQDKKLCAHEAVKRFPQWSNLKLAEAAGVSEFLIRAIREKAENLGDIDPEPVRITKSKRKVKVGKTGTSIKSKSLPKSLTDNGQIEGSEHLTFKDVNGLVVPEKVAKVWHRALETAPEILQRIKQLHMELMSEQAQKDEIFAEVNFQRVDELMSNLYHIYERVKPHSICFSCTGNVEIKPGEVCRNCYSRGYVSKGRYDDCTPTKWKEIAEKTGSQCKVSA